MVVLPATTLVPSARALDDDDDVPPLVVLPSMASR
jgi:hypothetical protein